MLVNLRNALMSGKRMPTARDYVQTGLVAMWDGIENAGWGTHDANATTWKDLVGAFDLQITPNSQFANTHLHGLASNRGFYGVRVSLPQALSSIIESGTFTVLSVNGRSPTCATYAIGPLLFANNTTNGYRDARNADSPYNEVRTRLQVLVGSGVQQSFSSYRTNTVHSTGILANGSSTSGLVDGTVGATVNYISDASFGELALDATSDFYNLLVYSRALTADEIAANYAIDKARFNLP